MTSTAKRIMICPLDWGIGHATRCIPVIQHLTELGHQIIIAADGATLELLRHEFPTYEYIRFPGVKVKYSTTDSQLFSIALQIPSMLNSIAKEHRFVRQKTRELNIDAIISDNRYGAYHKNLPSVLISHQLSLALPEKIKQAEHIVQRFIHRLINRFDQCWVPDFETHPRLSGKLSSQSGIKIPVHYIGLLSRFSLTSSNIQPTTSGGDYVLCVISGPEPQRSLFERTILKHFTESGKLLYLVRGLPGAVSGIHSASNIHIYNHLSGKELEELFLQADHIISRSGYSTLMDLLATGKKAFLVPTPGQPEQEYLANHMKSLKWFGCCSQNEFGEKYSDRNQAFGPPAVVSRFPLHDFLRHWASE